MSRRKADKSMIFTSAKEKKKKKVVLSGDLEFAHVST